MNDIGVKQIHIGMVDDHSLFRSGLVKLLSEFPDICVDFEAGNGKELVRVFPSFSGLTQVVLMDITMPGMDGYAATEWLKQNYQNVHVLALSMYEDDAVIIKMLKVGARGYIFKESKPTELHRAINEISSKGYFNNDFVTGRIMNSIIKSESTMKENELSERERQFISLCATEFTYKEIASMMKVATRTVDNYRESLFDKLNVKSRTGLALFALRNGYATL